MSNARSALTVVGEVVGAYFGGSYGAIAGGVIGGAIGGAIDGPVRSQQDLISDLSAIKFDYGSTWPRIYGVYKFKVMPMWSSVKRPIAHEQDTDSKGGPSAENTSFTYEQDWLCWAPLGAIGFSRIWVNGILKYSVLSDSDSVTVRASIANTAWRSATFFDGNPAQMPWAIYEAAVGAANAIGWRHRPTLGFEAVDLGGGGQPPLIEVEFFTAATLSDLEADVLLQPLFEGDASDSSAYNTPPTLTGSPLIHDGFIDTDSASYVSYLGSQFDSVPGGMTAESYSLPDGFAIGDFMPVGTITSSVFAEHIQFGWFMRLVMGVPTLHVGIEQAALSAESTGAISAPINGAHFALVIPPGATPTVRLYVNGNLQVTLVVNVDGPYLSYTVGSAPDPGLLNVLSGVRVSRGERYSANFTPPLLPLPAADAMAVQALPTPVNLSDIVVAEATLSWTHEAGSLVSGDLDVSELTATVTGFATAGSPREGIGQLADMFYFGCVCAGNLRFPLRGAASIGTVAFEDTGAGVGQPADPFTGLTRGNDLEVAIQVTVTGPNKLADYDPSTEGSDRLVGESVQLLQYTTPVVMIPSEFKGRADTMVQDGRVASHTGTVALDDRHVEKEPFDVWTQLDDEGNSYRVRAVSETYADCVRSFDVVLDDASVLSTSGFSTDLDQRAISIYIPPVTSMLLLDIPPLRDEDTTDPGLYAAFSTPTPTTPGAVLFKSTDNITFGKLFETHTQAVMGVTTTALGPWAGGYRFDMASSVTVDIGTTGTLTSATRAALKSSTTNAILIGSEVIQFLTATIITTGVYTLTGLLRGRRGTEWATDSHIVTERAVVLLTASLRRVVDQHSDVGMARYWKAVTIGASSESVTALAFIDTGVSDKPFSPVHLRKQVGGSSVSATWRRRTRVQPRFCGTGGISVPLGETAETYLAELRDPSDVLVDSQTLTSSSWTYPSSPLTGYSLTVYQVGADGPGYPATLEL